MPQSPIKNSHPSTTSLLLGLAIGDALGVPVEFMSRDEVKQNPVTKMLGYGTHHQPPGTWSDDSALAFCLAETIAQGFNLSDLADRFIKWKNQGYWSAHGTVFDIGIATAKAISRLEQGVNPIEAGGTSERDNGNGSLMRIAPLVFHLQALPLAQRFKTTAQVSALTHAHPRSMAACIIHIEYLLLLLNGKTPHQAYEQLRKNLPQQLMDWGLHATELAHFDSLLQADISKLHESEIKSTGYVIHTLEASTWCLLTTASYEEAVLKAVNLGDDTDTTAAVTGALAGLTYGTSDIPSQWISQIARAEDIVRLGDDLNRALQSKV